MPVFVADRGRGGAGEQRVSDRGEQRRDGFLLTVEMFCVHAGLP